MTKKPLRELALCLAGAADLLLVFFRDLYGGATPIELQRVAKHARMQQRNGFTGSALERGVCARKPKTWPAEGEFLLIWARWKNA
jgi:hypothetical protein